MSIRLRVLDLEHRVCLDWQSDDKQGICPVVWASYRYNDNEEHELCPCHPQPSLSDFHSSTASYLSFSLDSCSGGDYQLVDKVYLKIRGLIEKSDSFQAVLWCEYFRSCNLCVCYMVETLSTGLSQSSESKWSICLTDHTLTLLAFHQISALKIHHVLMIDRPRSNWKAFWRLLGWLSVC